MPWIMETVLLERSLPSMKVMFTGGGLKDKTAENAQAETCKSLWYTHYPELEKKLAI